MKRFPAIITFSFALAFSGLAGALPVQNVTLESMAEGLLITEKIFVPNTFTPNNDGVNDFLLFSTGGRKLMKFVVYNRRGDLVFFTKTEEAVWDGTDGTSACPGGVYLWVMIYEDGEGRPVETGGHVTLLR